MIDIKWAELHTTIFVAGTNLSSKLNPRDPKRSSLKMQYDRKNKELFVTYTNVSKTDNYTETAIVPSTNIVSMIEGVAEKREGGKVDVFKGKDAQVETPMGHVFAGEGHGKAGRG